MPNRALRTISLYPDAVTIEFVEPDTGIAANGLLLNQALTIPVTTEYEQGINNVVEAALALLEEALDDLVDAPKLVDVVPVQSEARDDNDDDEVGPYDNPSERAGVGT